MNRSFYKPNIIENALPYFIAYKPPQLTRNIYVEAYKSLEKAEKRYDHMKKFEERGEIIIPPFFADTEEVASEKARKLIPA